MCILYVLVYQSNDKWMGWNVFFKNNFTLSGAKTAILHFKMVGISLQVLSLELTEINCTPLLCRTAFFPPAEECCRLSSGRPPNVSNDAPEFPPAPRLLFCSWPWHSLAETQYQKCTGNGKAYLPCQSGIRIHTHTVHLVSESFSERKWLDASESSVNR